VEFNCTDTGRRFSLQSFIVHQSTHEYPETETTLGDDPEDAQGQLPNERFPIWLVCSFYTVRELLVNAGDGNVSSPK
jgi:hypothetical protein